MGETTVARAKRNMTLPSDRIVGRADEISFFENELAQLGPGRASALELVGEPGIGKTRLLAELSGLAAARGHLVLSGSASELERDLPFWVFVDALDEYVQALDPRRLDLLDDDARAELSHVFPSLAAYASGAVQTPQHERYRTHRAVRALLELLAATRPFVLELDDLHWADSGSVELVGALLRRPPAAPVLIAVAVRPRQLPRRLAATLDRAHREGRLARLELRALSSSESRELLGETVEGELAAALHEESGGNPFYLEQLARVARGRLEWRQAGPPLGALEVPQMVAAALTEELALLSEGTRSVLEGAAVAGDPFEPELAAAAASVTGAAVMKALDELVELDLVRPTEVPRRFRFRHPIVRRAVYEATRSGWRLGAHERCAETLAASGAAASARAHHVERSAREGDTRAAAVLREAGEETAPRAPATAARWFAEALRILPRSVPARERVELLLARAGGLTTSGQFADSRSALVEALAIVPDDDHELHARLACACAGVEHLLGQNEQARRRLTDSLRGLPDQRSAEAVALLIELAMNAFWRMRYDEMRERAESAVSASRPLDDAPLTAAALGALALADSMLAAPARAEADLMEAAALVDSLSDDELARRLDAATWLAAAERYHDRFGEADAHAVRALAVGQASGQGEMFLILAQLLGTVWCIRGKLAEAGELLDRGVEAARLLGNTHALVWSLFDRSMVALQAGDLVLALATAQESVDLSRAIEAGFHSSNAAVRLAAALLEVDQPERALQVVIASGADPALIPARRDYFELLTRCWLAVNRHDEAEKSAAAAEAWALDAQAPLASASANRAAAAVALHAGDSATAADKALAATEAAERVGAPIEASLSRLLVGRALVQAGDRERAALELQRATTQFEACGAVRYRDEAERELRRLGHRIYRRTERGQADRTGIEALTARELQLARLVAESKTNPQIATELFLSEKTVETHLRNIFRKLDVSSRVELALAVERAER